MIRRGVAILLGLLMLTGCGRGPQPTRAERAMAEGILIRGNGPETDSLDPHLATSVSAGNLLVNLFEGLTRLNPEDLSPEGGMAESWEVSEDGRVWTFHLREALWSNGDPVQAEDFVFAWRRMLQPELAASYAYMLFVMDQAREIHSGEAPGTALGAKALDARTLELRLTKPVPFLLSLVAHWTWMPLHAASLEAVGAVSDRTVLWTRPETMVNNGAFLLTAWVPENRIELKANPAYWQADQVRLRGAVFLPIADPATEERAFRNGDLHATYSLPRPRFASYRDSGHPALRVHPYLESAGWIVNLQRPALQDVRVREALSLAMQREKIVERVLLGTRMPAFTFVPPGAGGHQPAPLLTEDQALAAQRLAEAGFPGGEGLPVLEMILPNRADWVRVAEVLQQQWAAVGIRVQITSLERGTYFSRRRERNFDLSFIGWVGDFPDADSFLGLWRSDAGNNFSGWANETFDDLLNISTQMGQDRTALLTAAEALLLEELPILPMAFGATMSLVDPRVGGWHANLLDLHPLRTVYFRD